MATIGLRDLYRAPITIGTSGAEEYGTPVRMAKAISAELSVEVAEAILYADDGADEVVKEFVSGEITLNVNDLLPADLAALLGQKQDTDKVAHVFTNKINTAAQYGMNIRVTVQRGDALTACWVSGIGGNFE